MKNKKIIKENYDTERLPRGYEDTFSMPESELLKLSAQIKADLIQGEQDKESWLQERLKDVNSYFGIKKQADWPFRGAAKVSSQMHRVMVDTLAANLTTSATAPEEIIGTKTSKSSNVDNAKYVSDFHSRLARHEYHFPDVIDRTLHNALIESFRVLMPSYELETCETIQSIKRWLPANIPLESITYDSATDSVITNEGQVVPSYDIARLPDDPKALAQAGLQEVTLDITVSEIKEGIRLYSLPGANVYVSVSAPGETPFEKYQRAPYVMYDEYKTIDEMREMQNYGRIKNFELLASNLHDTLFAETLKDVKEEQAGVFDIDQERRRIIRNVWWYSKYEYKGKLRELRVYMNYETGTILKVKVNQFGIRPFFPVVPFPVDETPFGESLPKKIRSLVSELELVMNTLINMGMIKAYPPKFYDPNSGFDPKTLGNIGPNAYIPVRDPSRNVFLPPQPEDPRILMEMVKLLMDLIERATANSDAVQGQISPTANTTAFEVQQSLVRAGVRFDVIYRRIKEQLEPMWPYIQQLVLRYMPLEKEVKLMGEQAVVQDEAGQPMSRLQTIYKQEGQHGLTLTGNSLAEEQKEAQKAEKLFMLLGQDPYLSYHPESPWALRFNLIKRYNPLMMDKILPKPEYVAEVSRDRAKVQTEQEQKAMDDAQGSNAEAQRAQAEMQMEMQKAQLDMQVKMEELKLKQAEAEQKLRQSEAEHAQKLKQMEEEGQLKLRLLKEQSDAKVKASSKENNADTKS